MENNIPKLQPYDVLASQILNKKKRNPWWGVFILLLVVISMVGIYATYYFTDNLNLLNEYLPEQLLKQDIGDVAGTNTENIREAERILNKVDDLIQINDRNEISVVRVEDPANLIQNNPQFYADMKSGQYVLIFTETNKILIFDEEDKKIINFGSYIDEEN